MAKIEVKVFYLVCTLHEGVDRLKLSFELKGWEVLEGMLGGGRKGGGREESGRH